MKWDFFKKHRGELSTPDGREELGLLLLWVREEAATTWWAGKKNKETNRKGATDHNRYWQLSAPQQDQVRGGFLWIQTQDKDLSIMLCSLCLRN